ncbi:polyadenylate-binding protein-interacting protein 6 [Phtheirospermum japonicum]|uniref:Polyadenylate-binding protein-interacting protein 6 n=1 Tax=Phtheirospermum japonicum TaxID=374723 RepID=A0A830B8A4_9LAMI|nr:polyadenylate-binding protein-interacting protein 6 [Phtheirospermum japonicum]
MKAGTSSLNPYAASYVPLFKRAPTNIKNEFSPGQELNTGNEAAWFGHQPNNSSSHQNVPQSYGQTAAEVSKRKDTHGGEFFASTSQYPNNAIQQSFDEEFDMDLAYLQMTFPGISDESLSDVYLANRCDLDGAVDMLNQLDQIYPDDSMDKLPDTLDIGDVPESVSVAETALQKVKNPTAETGASTSSAS